MLLTILICVFVVLASVMLIVLMKQRNQKLLDELETSNLQYRRLVDEALDVLYTTDLSGSFTFVNDATEQLTGFSKEELLGTKYIHLIQQEYREEAIAFYSHVIQKNQDESYYEFPIIVKNGERKWVGQHVRFIRSETHRQQIMGFQAIVRDITRQKLNEYEMQKLALVAKATDNYVIITDESDRIEWVNESFTKTFGYTLDEVAGKSPVSFLRPEHFDPAEARNLEILSNQRKAFHTEIQNVTKTGQLIWVSVYANPLEKDGRLSHWITLGTDITVRKRSAERVRQLNERYSALAAVQNVMLQSEDEDTLIANALPIIAMSLDAEEVRVQVLEPRDESVVKDFNVKSTNNPGSYNPVEEGIGLVSAQDRERIDSARISKEELRNSLSERKKPALVHHIPLHHHDEAIGLVSIINPPTSEEASELATDLLRSLASGIHRARLVRNVNESRVEFKAFFDNTRSLITSLDEMGRFIYANAAFKHDLEYRWSELCELSFIELVEPAQVSRLSILLEEMKENLGQNFEIEATLRSKSGQPITIVGNGIASLSGGRITTRAILSNISEKQRDEQTIRLKNAELTDSINYALRIQNGILPSAETLKSYLPSAVLFEQPKDIVSGDFFLVDEIEDRTVLVVADCTGHGVPGGFMSVLGAKIVSDVVRKESKELPNKMLGLISRRLHQAFQQPHIKDDSMALRDGMEIGIAVIERANKTLHYSSSMIHGYIVYQDELTELRPSKKAIGVETKARSSEFICTSLTIEPGMAFYVFSDGYQNQFGGSQNKKLGKKRLKQLMTSVAEKPYEEQEEIITDYFLEWKGGQEQTDDVTAIGVKF